MHKGWSAFLLVILLMSINAASCFAQTVDTTALEDVVEAVDTTIISEVTVDKPNYFNAVTEETSTPISARKVPAGLKDSLRKDPDFWYADYQPEVKKPKVAKPSRALAFLSAAWFTTLLWTIVIGGFIAILIWFLKASDVRLYRKKEKPTQVSTEGIQENIFAINYDQEIAAAIAEGDYRQAVRLHYLQLLRHLSDTGAIDYRQERTNSFYRQQLFGTNLYSSFSRLTRHFEFVWYGKFPLSPEAFERIHQDYLQVKKEVAV